MKYLRLWFLAFPIILLFSLLQLTSDWGEQGKLESAFLREKIYPFARSTNGMMTNLKFRLRGEEHHKQKIVILAADDRSVEYFGRWPWHRDIFAHLIHASFKSGAKAMGLDVVFSESEDRIPEEILNKIQKSKLNPVLIEEINSLNTDATLAEVIRVYRNKLVLGFVDGVTCWPRYDGTGDDICPINDSSFTNSMEENNFTKFALSTQNNFTLPQLQQTPLSYLISPIANLKIFNDAAKYAGSFAVSPDPDGYIRRYSLLTIHQNYLFPSLALRLAQVVKKDEIKMDFLPDTRIQKIYFENSKEAIPSTPLGYMDLNFHATQEDLNYPVISAKDFLLSVESGDGKFNDLFKDSIVLFGATAMGIYDMRAFPFNSNSPGVEGHATAVDNILSGDSLKSASAVQLGWLPLFMLWVFGLAAAYLFSKLEAIPSIALFTGFLFVVGIVDIQFLFKNFINISSVYLLTEIFVIFVLILSIRYILEERNKKFIRDAFSHYLAPQVVDYVLKDPSKLIIGGERKELSVLFTDIRGFTTMSEDMDPKILSNFLNEYLTAMTEIIFEYGGTLDKYIGDAVMAFWGAPIYRADHAFQGAMAALHMQKKMGELQAGFHQKYGMKLEMGVGLNSGMVSVGNMGSQKIFDYTVIGDHVNLASRLEGLNRIYGTGVLCSQFTLDAIPESQKNQVHFRKIDTVIVKGKTSAIEIIELSLDPINPEAYSLFQSGREKFKNRHWDQAIEDFKNADIAYFKAYKKADPVCMLFIERAEKFKIHPPHPEWDGSIEMKEK